MLWVAWCVVLVSTVEHPSGTVTMEVNVLILIQGNGVEYLP